MSSFFRLSAIAWS